MIVGAAGLVGSLVCDVWYSWVNGVVYFSTVVIARLVV